MEWGEDYRQSGREALKQMLEEQMDVAIDRQLAAASVRGEAERRSGSYQRHLLTELGDLERSVPRAWRLSAQTVSRVAKTLDAAVAAFHRRWLQNLYRVLLLDGVVLKRETGGGAQNAHTIRVTYCYAP